MKTFENRLIKRVLACVLVASITALAIPAAIFAQNSKLFEPESTMNKYKVKNIIIMISDGCGYEHITATDYYQYGKTKKQAYESFPVKIGMSTYEYEGSRGSEELRGYDPHLAWNDFKYTADLDVTTDSASAATAMSTGVKTYNGAIGVDISGSNLKHVLEFAENNGKATGVITSVEFSHATPAGFVAHNVSRNNYADIANQMIYQSATDVIMGCGAPDYDDSGNPASKDKKYVGGASTWTDITDDGQVTGADANGDGIADNWTVIRDRAVFKSMAAGNTPNRVIGIPRVYTTLQQSRAGDTSLDPYLVPLTQSIPTLEEMTGAALNILDNDKDGLFLMIEGGAIDWASHANQSGRMIEEEIDFNKSVETVVKWINKNSNWNETLVIVTGDHECGYLTGPDSDPDRTKIINNGKGKLPGMEWHSIEHTNNIIPFFAKGVANKLFTKAANVSDPVRGKYLDNTDIGKIIIDLLD